MKLCSLDRHRSPGEPRTGELIAALGEQCALCDRYVLEVVVAFGAKVPIVARRRNDQP